jgi:adenylosuccinate synthase
VNKLTVVAGAQFGSEGKGSITGYIVNRTAHQFDEVVNIRVGGGNAGHTVYGVPCDAHRKCTECDPVYGHPWRLRQVPVGAVTDLQSLLLIGAGSEIDERVLLSEIEALDRAGYNVSSRLMVDQNATILEQYHIDEEQHRKLSTRIGSTAKGIGAARVDRLWRTAETVRSGINVPVTVVETRDYLRSLTDDGNSIHVVIEGTQGYGLGLHTQYYPQVTSGDCRAIDFLAQAGLNPWGAMWDDFEVILVARVYPIRVAGNSGPLKGETDWQTLGLPEEKTTVTKKVRRVGTWDTGLVKEAVIANGGAPTVSLAITMVDHMIPGAKDKSNPQELSDEAARMVGDLVSSVSHTCEADVIMVGTGPNSVIEERPNR